MFDKSLTKVCSAGLLSVVLAAALLLPSCSVKEDRDVCPAYLTVSGDGHCGDAGYEGNVTMNVATKLLCVYDRATQKCPEYIEKGHVFKVPRKEPVTVDVVGGLKKMRLTDSLLLIPFGFECDSLLLGTGRLKINDDTDEIRLPLSRCYANLIMHIVGRVILPYQYYFVVKGNVDGYVVPGLEPHRGPFVHRCSAVTGRTFTTRVPRQLDDSLFLEARSVDDDSLVTIVDIGKVAREGGYDWKAEDLDDIRVDVDFAQLRMTVHIKDWTSVVVFEIII